MYLINVLTDNIINCSNLNNSKHEYQDNKPMSDNIKEKILLNEKLLKQLVYVLSIYNKKI